MPRAAPPGPPLGLSRAALLRRGLAAGGLLALAAAPAARAASGPAPADDDIGFLYVASIGALVTGEYYRRARRTSGLSRGGRRQLDAGRRATRDAGRRLAAVLQLDAVKARDFDVRFPPTAFASPRAAARLGARLQATRVGVGLAAARDAADPATRLLLAELLAGDVQLLTRLSAVDAVAAVPLPGPLSVEAAGRRFETYLAVSGVQPEENR